MVNKKRLIDANALIAEYDRVHIGPPGGARKLMEDAPTVDAVEVVRCKDCEYFDPEKALRQGGIWCGYWGTDPDPDDFCSHGERRAE